MRKFTFLAVAFVLILSACQQTTIPAEDLNVLGMGTFSLGSDGLATASLSNTFYSVESGIEVTNVSGVQSTTNTIVIGGETVTGRVSRIQATIRNRSGSDINNLVLLAVSVEGLDESASPLSNVREFGSGDLITDPARLARIKPAHTFTLDNAITDFVAYAEGDLSESVRNSLQRTAKVPLAAVLPYGFRVGDIANGGSANVNASFFLPDAAAIGSLTFRFIAVEDTLERFTQGITEIELNDTNDVDVGYSNTDGVRQRYGTIDASKTLVLIGPYTRTVAQSDIDAGIFTLLPDIRIMGTAGNPIATLLDSGSSDLPVLVGN
jgi:hypothetical protein